MHRPMDFINIMCSAAPAEHPRNHKYAADARSSRQLRVAFQEKKPAADRSKSSASPLDGFSTEEDAVTLRESIWYSEKEIGQFRQDVLTECRQLNRTIPTTSRENLRLAIDENSRGLELHLCQARQRRRQQCCKAVLMRSQMVGGNVEELSLAAREASAYAVALALEEASRDYLRAYHGFRNEQRLEL